MCNGSLDSNCGAFAIVNECHCQKPLYSNFHLLTQKIKIYILPFGKGKKDFGKTVVLLLQLVMNWNDNQINSQQCFSRTNPLAYDKVEEMWETEHLPSRN